VIELASIEIQGRQSVVSMRTRIRALALGLRFDPVVATRLAMIASETARALARNASSPRLGVALDGTGSAAALALRFEGWASEPDTALLQRFFDGIEVSRENGSLAVVAQARLRDPELVLDERFIEQQRQRLQERSVKELMGEITSQNRELERHRHQLEEIVEERTAELHTARESAEQANQAKSQFLSSMSHELRTPLNGVLGYTQILQADASLSAEQREALDAIANCGRHLLTLINDVLDLSKIEAGGMELRPEPVDLERLVRSVFDIVRPRAESKGLEFRAKSVADLPRGIETDGTKFKQVLVNLLGNSVKFTDRGHVALRVSRTGERLRFEVEDSGLGMTPEELAGIFDPFKQAEGGQKSGGTGLGLAISKRIVEALGGSMEVESEKGVGSCFTVEMPLVEVELDESAAEDSTLSGIWNLQLAPGQEIAVLVADDNDVNRDILVRLLKGVGFRTVEAADGREAVDRMREQRPPLALLDIRMPNMSGIEAARAIRDDAELAGAKLIAVSADVLSSLEKELEEAGFDAFLSKPVRAVEVFRTLQKHLDLEFVEEGGDDETTSEDRPGSGELDLSQVAGDVARGWAGRMREAAELGDVAVLAEIAEEIRACAGAAPLGDQLDRVAGAFELDAVAEIASQLETAGG